MSHKFSSDVIRILGEDGFVLKKSSLGKNKIAALRDECDGLVTDKRRAGIRGAYSSSSLIRELVDDHFGLGRCLGWQGKMFRCLIFDKRPGANWKVGWHQDINIKNVDGEILPWERLGEVCTFRLHLDPTPERNGALKVIPGSHLNGKGENDSVKVVEAEPGDVLVLSPLLYHASSESSEPGHRRILHVDYL